MLRLCFVMGHLHHLVTSAGCGSRHRDDETTTLVVSRLTGTPRPSREAVAGWEYSEPPRPCRCDSCPETSPSSRAPQSKDHGRKTPRKRRASGQIQNVVTECLPKNHIWREMSPKETLKDREMSRKKGRWPSCPSQNLFATASIGDHIGFRSSNDPSRIRSVFFGILPGSRTLQGIFGCRPPDVRSGRLQKLRVDSCNDAS